MRSPSSKSGSSWAMTASTAGPALTMIITLRGRFRLATNSSIVSKPWICLPAASPAMNSSIVAMVRLNTET